MQTRVAVFRNVSLHWYFYSLVKPRKHLGGKSLFPRKEITHISKSWHINCFIIFVNIQFTLQVLLEAFSQEENDQSLLRENFLLKRECIVNKCSKNCWKI